MKTKHSSIALPEKAFKTLYWAACDTHWQMKDSHSEKAKDLWRAILKAERALKAAEKFRSKPKEKKNESCY